MFAINGYPQDIIVSCNYDQTGLEWVDLFDNPPLGWLVDEATGADHSGGDRHPAASRHPRDRARSSRPSGSTSTSTTSTCPTCGAAAA